MIGDWRSPYVATRIMDDGREIGVTRLLLHWTLHVDIDPCGYADRYCYATKTDALADLTAWTGDGDPPGRWHKHPASGRRRNPDTGAIWAEHERETA